MWSEAESEDGGWGMSKFRYPKCPYCGCEYKARVGDCTLSNLAIYGWAKEAKHKCEKCGKTFLITVKIMYYGKKIEVKHETD